MSGFAVIDLETTGFACNANDRVCDLRLRVAPALVNAAGRCRVDRICGRALRPWRAPQSSICEHISRQFERVAAQTRASTDLWKTAGRATCREWAMPGSRRFHAQKESTGRRRVALASLVAMERDVHLPAAREPVLWAADLAARSWARGGEFRAGIEPLVVTRIRAEIARNPTRPPSGGLSGPLLRAIAHRSSSFRRAGSLVKCRRRASQSAQEDKKRTRCEPGS